MANTIGSLNSAEHPVEKYADGVSVTPVYLFTPEFPDKKATVVKQTTATATTATTQSTIEYTFNKIQKGCVTYTDEKGEVISLSLSYGQKFNVPNTPYFLKQFSKYIEDITLTIK